MTYKKRLEDWCEYLRFHNGIKAELTFKHDIVKGVSTLSLSTNDVVVFVRSNKTGGYSHTSQESLCQTLLGDIILLGITTARQQIGELNKKPY